MTLAYDTPVLIVGAGPAGLAMSLDLARRGNRSIVVEQGPETQELLFKAGALNERTLEFCRWWGVRDAVYDWGQPQNYPRDTCFCVSLDGPYIGRDPMPAARDWPVRDSSPEQWRKCPQYIFDPILARAALATGLVDIRYDTEFVEFVQDAEGVTATVRRGDAAELIRAQYLVGCDGAGSKVRQQLGIGFDGLDLDFSVSIMLEIENFEQYHDMGRLDRIMFIDTEGTYANITSVNHMNYWRFTMVGSEERLDPAKLDVDAVLRRAFGNVDVPYKVLRVVPWRRAQYLARKYGEGRVWLAADACHTTSPTGGHGINTGLGDVIALSWMLDANLKGWAGPKLLDAYTFERRPVALRNFSASTRNYRFWVGRTDDFGQVRDEGHAGAAARHRLREHFSKMLYPEWHSYGIAMGYRYENSPICVHDGSQPTPDETSIYVQTSRPGHIVPHAWLEPGKALLDLLGTHFVLLRFDATVDVTSLEQAAARIDMPLQVITLPDGPEIAELYQHKLCLVRPDGHSAWRGDALPKDVDYFLGIVTGHGDVTDHSMVGVPEERESVTA